MKIRGVEIEEYIRVFATLFPESTISMNWQQSSPTILGKSYRLIHDRSYDSRGPLVTRSIWCDQWNVHLENIDGPFQDDGVRRLVFSGCEDTFMSDMIALKMAT